MTGRRRAKPLILYIFFPKARLLITLGAKRPSWIKMSKPYNIFHDSDLQCIVMDWDGYATSTEFREGTELMLKLLKQNKMHKVLADIKDMTLISGEDQHYVQYNFLPRAINGGFRAIAIVRPTSYFNAVAIETMSYRVKQTVVQMHVFDDVSSAKAWLASLENS